MKSKQSTFQLDLPYTFKKFRLKPSIQGLRNHGFTCYMNCVLQSIFHTSVIVNYSISNETELQASSNVVVRKIGRLLNSMWKNCYNKKYSQDIINLAAKCNSNFKLGIQQDAQEFLLWLLNSIKGNNVIAYLSVLSHVFDKVRFHGNRDYWTYPIFFFFKSRLFSPLHLFFPIILKLLTILTFKLLLASIK